MAGTKIRGITIELGADTTKLSDAFQKTTKELATTQKYLKDVDKLLKFDPKNVELLTQKSDYLNTAIEQTKAKLKEERQMLEELSKQDSTPEIVEQQNALKREIASTEGQLSNYENQLADTNNKLHGMADATEEVAEESKDAQGATTKLGDIIKAKLASEAIISGIKALGAAFKKVGESLVGIAQDSAAFADEMMVLSTQTGLSTDALQEYAYMAELVDTDVSTITGSMTKLIRNMSSAKDGSKAQTEAFKALGVSVTNANGELRDSTEVFDEVINALGGVQNETERNALAMDIFGKSAMDLNPLIAVGADGLAAFREEAHATGYVLDNEALNALGGVDDAFQRLNNTQTSVKNTLGSQLAPIITNVTNKLVEMANSVDWVGLGNTISDIIQWFLDHGDTLITIIAGVGAGFATWAVVGLITKLTEAMNGMTIAQYAVATAQQLVNTVLKANPIGLVVTGIIALTTAFIAAYKESETFRNIVNGVFEKIKTVAQNVVNFFTTKIPAAFKTVSDKVAGIFQAVKDFFGFKWELPHIKLPHFGIQPRSWRIGDLLKGVIPKLTIDWYAKGMEGMILKQPTIFGINGQGQPMVGGEVGNEIIVGQNNLMRMIKAAVGQQGMTVNMTINPSMGMNEKQLAQYAIDELNAQLIAKRKVWA